MNEPLSIDEKIDAFIKRIDNPGKEVNNLKNENKSLKT